MTDTAVMHLRQALAHLDAYAAAMRVRGTGRDAWDDLHALAELDFVQDDAQHDPDLMMEGNADEALSQMIAEGVCVPVDPAGTHAGDFAGRMSEALTRYGIVRESATLGRVGRGTSGDGRQTS